MKRNKKIQEIADYSLAEYHDEKTKNELKTIIQSNKAAKEYKLGKRKKLLVSSLVSAAVIAIIATLITVMPLIKPAQESKQYLSSNQILTDVELSSLNADLSYFVFDVNSQTSILKVTDTFYNETLYYIISIPTGIGGMEINIITNRDYKFLFDYQYDKKIDIGEFQLNYCEDIKQDDNISSLTTVYGEIKTDKENIYFEYTDIVLGNESNFVDLIHQIIKRK